VFRNLFFVKEPLNWVFLSQRTPPYENEDKQTVFSSRRWFQYCQLQGKTSLDILRYVGQFSRHLKMFIYFTISRGTPNNVPLIPGRKTLLKKVTRRIYGGWWMGKDFEGRDCGVVMVFSRHLQEGIRCKVLPLQQRDRCHVVLQKLWLMRSTYSLYVGSNFMILEMCGAEYVFFGFKKYLSRYVERPVNFHSCLHEQKMQ
jgi:hypothetical protein